MTAETPPKKTPRNPLFTLFVLLGVILAGAYLSAIPLVLVKGAVATLLIFLYGVLAAAIVEPMGIASAGARKLVGLLLGAVTLYLTWAIRLPVFSEWEVGIRLDPLAIIEGVQQRAGSMEVSSGFGQGTTADGPSWLLLGTYIVEAIAIVGAMYLGAWFAAPDKPKDESQGPGEADALESSE